MSVIVQTTANLINEPFTSVPGVKAEFLKRKQKQTSDASLPQNLNSYPWKIEILTKKRSLQAGLEFFFFFFLRKEANSIKMIIA